MSKKVYLLWFGQTVSWTGSAMSFFAIGVWIYETTGKASALSSILFIVISFAAMYFMEDSLNEQWQVACPSCLM